MAGTLAGMRRVAEADVRFAAGVPNVGPFGDLLLLTDLTVAAEDSGWDAFFIWDHLLYRDQRWPVADPTVVIAAVAARTSRIRFGVLMNQLARTPAVPAIDALLRECPHGRTRVSLRPRRRLCVVLRATPRRRAGADR